MYGKDITKDRRIARKTVSSRGEKKIKTVKTNQKTEEGKTKPAKKVRCSGKGVRN